MRVGFFYFAAFVCLIAGMAAMADGDYISAATFLVLFLWLPIVAKWAA